MLLRCVYLQRDLQRRYYSFASRLRSLLSGESNKEIETPPSEEETPQKIVPVFASLEKTEQHLKLLADNRVFSQIPLTNLDVKSKVLLSCEKELGRSVACSDLGSLQTLDDLWSLFCTQPHFPVSRTVLSEEEQELFPSLKDKELPVNLSVELPIQKPKPKRMPFQNYDDPKHFNFQHKRRRRQFGRAY